MRKAFVFPELPLRSYKYHHPAKSLKKTKPFRGTKALTGCGDERGNYRTEGPKREEKGARQYSTGAEAATRPLIPQGYINQDQVIMTGLGHWNAQTLETSVCDTGDQQGR